MENEFSSAQDFCDVVPDKTKDTYWPTKLKLIEDIKEIVGTVETGKKILNVLVVGTSGCGKSSFINTALTSFREDKWQMYTAVGMNKGNITNITQHFKSFPAKSSYFKEEPDFLLPTFIDINGLEDDKHDFNRAFLRALFDGKIQENEQIIELLKKFQFNPAEFNEEMSRRTTYLKIDRIIVVTTADPEEQLPKELLKCIKEVTDDVKGIPIFGVMTKKDKFKENENITERINEFMGNLGIDHNRFKWIQNYCYDVDKDMKYHSTVCPSIDVPVLCLITQVINPNLRPHDPLEDRPGVFARIILKLVPYVCTLIQIVVLCVFLADVINWMILSDIMYKDLCDAYDTLGKQHNFTLPGMSFICNQKRRFSIGFFHLIVSIAFFLFLCVLPNIVKKLVFKGLNSLLSGFVIAMLPLLVYIYIDKVLNL